MEIIGSGGNINKLYYLSGTPGGEPLTVRSLTSVVNRLRSIPVKKRIDDLGLKPDRADVIVPAGEIYMQVASHLGVENIWVPTIGIVDGITYTLCAGYIRDHKCEN